MPPETRIAGVSAVVCNYDGEAYLADCLRSILAQEGLDEVIVVDDASTDGSVALVRRLFPDVRVIELDENRGPCAARNRGLREARQRFVLAVDNDAVLRPDVLGRLRQALEERPEVAIAMPRSVLHDEPERVHYDSGAFHYVGLLSLRNFYTPLSEAVGEGVVETSALIGICVLMDRDAVLEVGGYDEAFFYLAEDYELSYRLKLTGHRLVSVEEAIVLHRGGTAGLSFRGGGYPEKRAYLHAKNRLRILFKCYRWRTLLVAAPGIFLYELVWLAFTLKAGHLKAGLRGKLALAREWSELMAARRELQARRTVPDRELLVGGPLTFSPSLVATPWARAVTGLVDGILRGWWWIVRHVAG